MHHTDRPIKPEIMSPAGYWPQLNAAVEAGADAVYFGLKHFSARAKVGFSLEELPDVMRTLHRRGVKGYVTFNTLVFDHELQEAARSIAAIAAAGADALIVQDVGIAQLVQRIAPDAEVHGSTQMSITSAEGIALAQQFGVTRVVLARELALDDVRAIRAATDCELEMFVHGALCVSYSGQCFSSEAWGGRSANRGQCAQACRLPYELIVDDQLTPLGDARYLLSPGDLYALQQMPEIVRIGVHALKIEGRYKDADYVALTTAAYRQAVDEAWAGLPLSITALEELQLEQVYSRGLGPHFIAGVNHQTVVNGRSPRHRGVLMGRVSRVLADRVWVMPDAAAAAAPLKPGDGVVFDAADWRSPEEPEEGGRVYHVTPRGDGALEVTFGNGALNFARIRVGDLLWRSHDPELDKAARPYTAATAPVHKQPVNVAVTAAEGAPLRITWTLADRPDAQVTLASDEPLPTATQRAIDAAYLREQLGRLGGTPYTLADLTLDMHGRPFAPASLLNHLRRQAVEQLQALQEARPITVNEPLAVLRAVMETRRQGEGGTRRRGEGKTRRQGDQENGSASVSNLQSLNLPSLNLPSLNLPSLNLPLSPSPSLHLLVRTPEQLNAALTVRPASITLDYLELYGLRPAVERVQAASIEARVASPRVLKPNEQRIVNFLLRLDCTILVRSAGLLHALREASAASDLIGDFSLNAANELTARTFLALGLTRLTPTHDLNAAQVTDLAQRIGPEALEVIAYQHLPVFHTEHCVFCRFLSAGTSYKDCGHPCEQHKVALRDSAGREHPVLADVGCRNTVFGAEAQNASAHLDAWRATGIRHYRLEFVHESGEQVRQVADAFHAALAGKLTGAALKRQLQRIAPQGVTEGSLFVPPGYLEIPLLI
ncbi:U32 family peptidase [Caldilinea sp.]|uniref:U32 family peptidase n=1 Tax=Caldilinea sp. TaxID=2293560 RepID=UPI002BAEEF0D|nr:U32 family peptidase [Caldilinea sp.]